MELKARFEKKTFTFKKPSGTSRGILTEKHAWFIELWDPASETIIGVGECSIIPGLSPDFQNESDYEAVLQKVVNNPSHYRKNLHELETYPSIYFGFEMALLDLKNGGKRMFFDTPFTHGKKRLPINGLVWMGDISFMQSQIDEKIRSGFDCIKIKIGALDFEKEISLIEKIREQYTAKEITIRVDANGAFKPEEALDKLTELSKLDIHSIEQPIKPDQWKTMRMLCEKSPVPIALDEELIGHYSDEQKSKVLNQIKPQYIILKPSLIGGFRGTTKWINLAEQANIGWWITSALESNIGLDAIAQYTSNFDITLPQGLGTGSLYTNNIPSKLHVAGGYIYRN